jgi:diguanylate cyclase (GGDEF)-like protein
LLQFGTALVFALVVAGVLVLLDGVGWPVALAAAGVALLPALVAGTLALSLARELAQSQAQRELISVEDGLTGVSNRRQFLRLADREWARCRRYGDDGALLMIDADHLRRINDNLGQRGGDAVLLEVSRRVGATLRQSDLLARFGGAELAVFLPHTDPLGALDAAERIRQQVASAPCVVGHAQVVATVSVGVAHVHAGQMTLDGLIQESEAALKAAKEAGRNCVRAAPIQPRRSGESRSVTPS